MFIQLMIISDIFEITDVILTTNWLSYKNSKYNELLFLSHSN